MRVLVVYAHPNPRSFCHAVLERVTSGLRDAGHDHEVIDLHAMGFDPVFRNRDHNQFVHESLPDDLIEEEALQNALLARAGGPVRRAIARRWMRGKTAREIVEALGRRTPRDVRRHQEKVARSEGLIFIAPVYWMGLPAILCDWGLRMAGVQEARHVYLYAVEAVDHVTRVGYLDLAYRLGRDFWPAPA